MNTPFPRRFFDRFAFVVVAELVLGLVGCAPSTGKLAGAVTLNGAPLAGGKVHVVSLDELGNVTTTTAALISPDGSYETFPVPLGSAKILLQGPPIQIPMTKPPPGWVESKDPVPARYRAVETTDLIHMVVGGVQQYDIHVSN